MADIHYCDEGRNSEWEYERAFPGQCEIEKKSQDDIDEWISYADTNWSADEPKLPGIDKPSLEEQFLKHAEHWQTETAHLSSPSQMMMHPSYQAVLGIAQENKNEVIRLMLTDLRDKRRLWFWALSFLTKENPITALQAGKIDPMISAWVKWGHAKGII
jgi:hypothetical protein